MTNPTYADLGWTAHFERQAAADTIRPLRITEVHRTEVTAISPEGERHLLAPDGTGTLAVGDWVLADGDAVTQVCERQSLLKRRAPGTEAREQLIAANVTTLGIVSSCNADFNERRLEHRPFGAPPPAPLGAHR